jgi:hypothetical protein
MKNVTLSAVRCLAIAFSLIISAISYAQGPDYIMGFGCVRNADGTLDRERSTEQAIEHLCTKISDETGVQVSTHTTLKNDNGRQDYRSVTVVDSGIVIPKDAIEIIHWDVFWIARIERNKVIPQEVKWVEQNITINNTVNSAPTYSRGYVRNESTTRTTRKTNYIGPSGRVVKTVPGKTSEKRKKSAWNGRYGWTRESSR